MSNGWSENSILVNQARLHYFHLGQAGKPPMVLVHGFSDNGLCWQPLAEELQLDYDIYMPDMRGHGLSERVQPNEKIDMPADLRAFICALRLKRPIVGGHSMGAAIAFGLGARYPGVPAALVLEDPPWFDASPAPLHAQPGRPNPMAQLVEHWEGLSVEQLIAETRLEHPTWSELTTQRWCAAKKQLDPIFLATNSFPRANWRTALKKIACPTLLITADPALGGIVTTGMAQAAQQINSRVQVVNFPGVGHHIRFAVHAEYIQSLKAFLSSLAG